MSWGHIPRHTEKKDRRKRQINSTDKTKLREELEKQTAEFIRTNEIKIEPIKQRPIHGLTEKQRNQLAGL